MLFDFPDDDNGAVLRRFAERGDNLSRPRDIDFSVVFPQKEAADQFANHFRSEGYKVKVYHSDITSIPWNVTVTKNMSASHDEISDFERLLQASADHHGGSNDGWGFFTERN